MPPYIDLLILALVAGFILIKLRHVLGSHDHIPKSYKKKQRIKPIGSFPLPHKAPSLPSRLKAVKEMLPDFKEKAFLEGAKKAYQLISTAFVKEDMKTLNLLTTEPASSTLQQTLSKTKKQGLSQHIEIVNISKATILSSHVNNHTAFVEVALQVEQCSYTTNKKGDVIAGNKEEVETIEAIWTWSQSRKDKTIWKLSETS